MQVRKQILSINQLRKTIERVFNLIYLKFDWTEQINEAVQECFTTLNTLKVAIIFTRKELTELLVLSKLDYFSVCK